MSATIDERVVSMQFDNKQFESNVQTSLGTIEKLKQSLNFSGASKGLENVSSAAKSCDMSYLGNAVETVKLRFSALEVMAVTALSNITNSAVNAGKRLVSAFTIDPIKSGFQEYETQINAVQTILANTESKGTTLTDVNNALDTLNAYADKTIYNFTEMTRNIGTFTAAGVDLDTSVNAIQGIANLAAVSGSTSQQASTAMYQLSQALASGTVKLQDWNSVVNAGMGGQVFQDALKETARVHGIKIDEMIKKQGSFRETLSEGWLTSEILTETLQKFTLTTEGLTDAQIQQNREMLKNKGYTDEQIDAIFKLGNTATNAATKVKTFTQLMDTLKEAAQSGWTQTWELLVGDFEEAKELWTSVSDIFGGMIADSAEARNTMLEGALLSNWDQLINKVNKAGVDTETFNKTLEQTLTDHGYNVDELVEKYGSLENAFKAGAISTSMLKAAITNLKIPGLIGDCLDLINNIDKLGGRELLIESLKNAFEGLMSIVKPIKEAFREVFPPMTSEQLYSFIEGLRDLTAKFKLNDDQAQKLKDTFKGLFNALKTVANFFISIGKGAISLLGNFSGLGDGILTVTSSLGNWLTKLKESSENANIFGKAVDGIVNFVQSAINALKNFASAIKLDFKVPGFESFLSVLTGIWNFIQKIGSKIAGLGTVIGQNLSKMFTVDNIKEALNIANSGLLAGVLLAIKNFFGKLGKSAEDGLGLFDKLKGIADNVTEVFNTLGSSLKTWQQSLKADILIKIAGAIGILALSILAIASVEPDKLASSLGAITVLFGDLMGSLAIFGKMDSNLRGVTKAVGIMIGMSFAILILASALKKLASLSWEEIAKGLVGIAGLMGELMLAMLAMSNINGSAMKGATQIVIFALAIKILASVCNDLSSLSWEELGKGLAGVGGLLAEVSIFLRTAKFGGKAISTALGIAILSGAIKILASACKDFGAMSWMEIGKGLASIGGLLLELAAFTRLTGNAKNVVSTGLALVLIGASMKIFASAVKDFSKMSWEEIGRGLLAMAGALAAVTLALRFMPKNTLSTGIGLVVVSAALMILANVMSKMGGMSWDEIGKGLATLGGAIVILSIGLNAMNGTLAGSASLVVAALSLAILTPVLKTLGSMSWESIAKGLITIAGAFAVIGIAGLVLGPVIPAILGLAGAMALIGVGVLALGAGLVVAAAGITALSLAIAAGATSIVAGLSVIITGFIGLIPAIITGICDGIAASITSIGNALKALVLVGIDVLVSCIPAIVDGVLKLVSEVLASLAGYTPQIVDSLLQFVISVINGLAIRMPELIQAALNLLASFFAGITEAFASMDTSTLINAGIGIGIVAAIMGVCSLLAPIIPTAMAGVLGAGAVIAELALVLAAIGALAQIPGLDWLVGEGGALLESIGNAIGGFVGGIVGGVLEGVSNSLPAVATNLSTFMTNLQPFIDGAQQLDPSMLEGVNSLVGIITAITAANLLESITSFITGGSSITTFGAQLVPFGQAIADFASVVTGINTEAITSAAVAAQGLAEVANAIPAEGGIIQKFSGEQDLSSFGTQLVSFGQGMKSFADSVVGIDTAAIAAAAVAAQGLAEVANAIPAEGGIIQKFSGEQNLSSFGTQLVSFGQGIKSFADSVVGIDTAAITAAATASQSLATLASNIPAEGGIIQKFTGEQSLENFGTQIGAFGAGMKAFSDNVAGIDVASVTAATKAGVKLSEMANSIPDQGGFISWFTGSQDLTNFGTQVTKFGEGIKGYADAVAGIDVSSVNSATAAAVSLGSMASSLPEGESIDKVKWLGEKLKGLGEGIKDFSDQVTGINVEASNSAISVVRSVSSIARFLPDAEAIDKVKWLGEKLKGLGSGIKDFATEVSGVDTSSLSSATTEIGHLSKMLSRMSGMDFSSAESFSGALKKLSKTSVDDFIKAFTNAKSKVTAAIKSFMDNASSGIKSNTESMTKASEDLVTKCVSALKDEQSKFSSAGKYLVEGFANGISSNAFMAEAKAKAMAEAAIKAAKEALKEHSPSKVFYGIGAFAGKGFVNAFSDYEPISYKAGGSIAESAVNGLRKAITNVQDVIENGIDSQPTIRPVLDLSNVAAGSDYIRDMLDMNPSLGTMANIRSISSNMNRNQNGANDDVISAIRDLGHKIESTPSNSYTVNGITYDDGSNVSDAVKALVRAARVERRI